MDGDGGRTLPLRGVNVIFGVHVGYAGLLVVGERFHFFADFFCKSSRGVHVAVVC
jgi:hypothetical protein